GHSFFGKPRSVNLVERRATPSKVATTATVGENSAIWEASASTFWPAANPYTWYAWRLRRTTSKVLVPIDPVEPKTVSVFIARRSRAILAFRCRLPLPKWRTPAQISRTKSFFLEDL